MPDPSLDDVLAEAFASASADKQIIDTISIWYDGLQPTDGGDEELYLFNGDNATTITEDGVPLLTARIEAGAPRNAGQLVTFIGIPFSITLPSMADEAEASAQLRVDSVGREMHTLLEAAAKGGKTIYVTYRAYVKGTETDGPHNLPPRRFIFSDAAAMNDAVEGRLAFLAIGNRAYPFDSYTPDRFPTLSYG